MSPFFRSRLGPSSLITATVLAVAASSFACSSASEEPETSDEGALMSLDDVMDAIGGEVSQGETLPGFKAKTPEEKQSAMWTALAGANELRCHIDTANASGDALVAAMERCATGSDPNDLQEATLGGTLRTATYQILLTVLAKHGLMAPAFDNKGDEIAAKRKKVLHPFGATGKVELRIDKRSSFTGFLAPPANGEAFTRVRGIGRLGTAGPESLIGFVPCLGLKLFAKGSDSADIPAMHGFSGQEDARGDADHNLLAHSVSTEMLRDGVLAEIANATMSFIHRTSRYLPTDHLGLRNLDGTVPASPKSPSNLTFDPDPQVSRAMHDYLAQHPKAHYMTAIAFATKDATEEKPVTLYTLRSGHVEKDAKTESELPAIGTVVATSPFLASRWGDRQLFIRHNRGCTPVESGMKTTESPSLCDKAR